MAIFSKIPRKIKIILCAICILYSTFILLLSLPELLPIMNFRGIHNLILCGPKPEDPLYICRYSEDSNKWKWTLPIKLF